MTLTLDELKQTKEWKLLNDNEQAFLLEYISSGFNVTEAAAKTFNTGSAKSATVYGRRVLDRPRVAATLAKWGGSSGVTEQELWEALRQAMRQNDSWNSKVQAIRLAAELTGLLAGSDKPQLPSAPHVPKELVGLVADRLGEMPVGRIMSKLGIRDMQFLPEGADDAESHNERASEEPQEAASEPSSEGTVEQPPRPQEDGHSDGRV